MALEEVPVARWQNRAYVENYLHVMSDHQYDGHEWDQILALDNQAVVLDLGCGDARFLIALSPFISRGLGVDISTHQIEHAQANIKSVGVSNIQLVQSDFRQLKLEAESIDIVYSQAAIHHVPDVDKQQLFSRISVWLKSGGLLYLHDDTFNFPPEEFPLRSQQIRAKWEADMGAEGYEWMKQKLCYDDFEECPYLIDVESMIQGAGLKIEHIERCGPYQLHGAIIKARKPIN